MPITPHHFGHANPESTEATNATQANKVGHRRTDTGHAAVRAEAQAGLLAEFAAVGAGGTRGAGWALSSAGGIHVENIPTRPELTGPTPNARTPTPGASYRADVTPQQVAEALDQQDGYARYQWATGQGVVGPVGHENEAFYAGCNDPAHPAFAQYQQFGCQHDMQAADAGLQDGWFSYDVTLAASALRGMDVLRATGDADRALAAARREWRSSGFEVRTRY